MPISPLANYVRLTDKYNRRNHKIDTVTIHCYVGQVTAKKGVDYFCNTKRECSANYVVGYDGSIGCCVDEKYRSWCSNSKSNDCRAVTIEVACEKDKSYRVNASAMRSLIKLLADICERNDIEKLVWSDDKEDRLNRKNGVNMTVHRDFANKSCPGEYLYKRMRIISNLVNMRIGR